MRQRRTRYTVEFHSDTRKMVILAYNSADAAEFYTRRGFNVKRVTKGDYRKPHKPITGARPDHTAIQEAASFLDLSFPVEVRTSSRQGGAYGHYIARYRAGRWRHSIMVKSWLDAEQMGRTLWHELTHAMQFERDSFRPGLAPNEVRTRHNSRYRDGTSYHQKPAEVEANSYMDYNSEIPLAR